MHVPGPGLAYHQVQRIPSWRWWRPLLGTIALVVMAMFVVQIGLVLAFGAYFVLRGDGFAELNDSLADLASLDPVTPLTLAFLNLSLAAAIPVAMLVQLVCHQLHPGWLSSVARRLRWRWLLVTLGLSLVALLATLAVGAVLPAQDAPGMSEELNPWTDTTRDFLLVIVLLTPLQAAGEEYAFRGYLTQAFGGWLRSRWAAVLIPAVLFALAHGAQDPPVFVDRLAFGIVAGILVITTGGLEAGIAMHVLNNFLAYGLALAFSDMTTALNPTAGSWWMLPVTLTQSLVYLGLCTYAARKLGIATATPPPPVVWGATPGPERPISWP